MAGQSEVQHHHVLGPAPAQEEVGGLDVAVDDALLVRRGQPLGGAAQQRQHLGEAQRLAQQPVCQVLPLEPLHGQVGLAVLGAPWAT